MRRKSRVLCTSGLILLGFWLTAPGSAADEKADVPGVLENSLGMQFVLVPAGEYLMGNDASLETLAKAYPRYEKARLLALRDEAPVHRVRITRPFYLGRYEVTVGQFSRFVAASSYIAESEADGTGAYGYDPAYDPSATVRGDAFEGRLPKYSWRNPGFAQSDEHPVLNVTYNDAQAMARWLSEQEGVTYRLPTEAEWEYACRAGSNAQYPNGNDPQALVKIANIFDSEAAKYWAQWRDFALSGSDGFAFSAPVGSFAPNAFGIHDMLGNAWEWVADWYAEDQYMRSVVDDPQGPEAGNVRVRRGGSWHTWPLYARCAFRNWNTPQTRYVLLGMRLLRELGPAKPANPRALQ